MNNSLKGALLSGLVIPGLGQIALKHYRRGAVLLVAALACMVVIIMKAAAHALAILEDIDLTAGAIDMNAIAEAAAEASTQSDSLVFNLMLLVMILCWIISIVDAYRIGKQMDLAELE
jgi:hypothetical protein